MVEEISIAVSEACWGGIRRGMLQGNSRGEAPGVQGLAAGVGSGEQVVDKGDVERRRHMEGSRGSAPGRKDPGGETS